MPENVLYMKCDANVEIDGEDVFLKDVASLQCADEQVLAKCKCIKIWHFSKQRTDGNKAGHRGTDSGKQNVKCLKKSDKQERVVISTLKLISMVEETCPGTLVEIIGETDVVIEHAVPQKQDIGQWLKITVVCLVCFFGTAFTIMAYHNDVGIRDVFSQVYEIVTGNEAKGINPLEVSYSIGLAVGILVFFNHVGNLKLTKDPTPIEVSMKNYEADVNKTLVEVAGRRGEEVDV